jgi:dephospho-CoA kinase
LPPSPPAPPTPRIVLGLLGGISSGKSTVSEILARLGPGRTIDADALARVALDAAAKDGRLVAALGPWAVTKAGTPDRKAIAKRVFAEAPLLRALERITHPSVLAQIEDALDEHRSGKGPPVLVLDVPLLVESGVDRRCDTLWFVDAPDAARFARAKERLGLTREDVLGREAAQTPLERKRTRADLVIDNSGAPEALEAQVAAGLRSLGLRTASAR